MSSIIWSRRHRRTAPLQMIGRRILIAIPILIVVTAGVFALAVISPLDPLDAYLNGQSASLTPTQRDAMRAELGLDLPWWQAWWSWATSALGGDFGHSLSYRQSVASVVGDRLPWTIILGVTGLVSAVVISTTLGLVAALRPGSGLDRMIATVATLLQAIPPFVLGMGTIAVFAVGLRLLPTGGLTDPGEGVTTLSLVRHLFLPWLVFTLSQLPWLILGLRETLVHTLTSDTIAYARLRGVPRTKIICRHVMPMAAPPFIALVAMRLPELIAGSAIVEAVFAWPGLGAATVQAAQRLDFALLCFLTVATTAFVLTSTLIADVLYVILDPRVDVHV